MVSITGIEANAEQSERVILGLRVLAGGFPLVFFGLSLILIGRFGLDEDAHRSLQARLR